MLGLKLNHVSKRGHSPTPCRHNHQPPNLCLILSPLIGPSVSGHILGSNCPDYFIRRTNLQYWRGSVDCLTYNKSNQRILLAIVLEIATHWCTVTHVCVSELGHHWCKKWLGANLALFITRTSAGMFSTRPLRTTLRYLNRNAMVLIREIALISR